MTIQQSRNLIDVLYGSPLDVLSQALRGFIIPKPKHKFIGGDFSAIESRVLNWLAGEERVLQMYRTHGKIYEYNAAQIYSVNMEDVTKDQRQVGKVAELALGYQGGVRAFQSMARNYGVKVEDKFADRIKVAWREAHPNIVNYWYKLEQAAIQAIQNPLQTVSTGSSRCLVRYKISGSFLWCQLPSNRVLCYPYPKIEPFQTPWGATKEGMTFMGENTLTHKWERQKAYGGFLSENITQAVARDLMVEAMFRLERKNYPIVLHVHDEILSEVPTHFGSVKEYEDIMCEIPSWAKDLPIQAEGWTGPRYKK